MSAAIPCGYIRLTSTFDGRPFLLYARGLVVALGSGTHRAGQKHADGCIVGPTTDTDSYWTIAETFDEVQAALVVALGAQGVQAKAIDSPSKRAWTHLSKVDVPAELRSHGVVTRLMNAGIFTVQDLAKFTRSQVGSRMNIGRKVLAFCDAALASSGLCWVKDPGGAFEIEEGRTP